mmetsp:Transcript_18285/g.46084  ORF Transcript_18285/g.46084 Transcript_18285/m.46084 type:complete len:85 (+) Transcript_18285:195-449(+)
MDFREEDVSVSFSGINAFFMKNAAEELRVVENNAREELEGVDLPAEDEARSVGLFSCFLSPAVIVLLIEHVNRHIRGGKLSPSE